MNLLGKILLLPFVALVAAIWVVIGFAFWLPLLAKAIMLFTLELLIAAIRQKRAKGQGGGLRQALTFYPRGFAIIFSSIQLMDQDGLDEPETKSRGFWQPLFEVLQMSFLTLAFWLTTILFFHHTGIFPLKSVSEFESKASSLLGLPTRSPPDRAETIGPSTDKGKGRYVLAFEANLREGAGAQSRVLRRLHAGDVLFVDPAELAKDWAQVTTADGAQGFVSRRLLGTPTHNE